MSHNYLFDAYQFIDQRLREHHQKLQDEPQPHDDDHCFTEGRIEALAAFQQYLSQNFNGRLPKRLYRRIQKRGCP